MFAFQTGLILAVTALAAAVTPVAPETAEREPQLAASGSTVGLTFGVGNAIISGHRRTKAKPSRRQ